jgi:hypothetical protein
MAGDAWSTSGSTSEAQHALRMAANEFAIPRMEPGKQRPI